MAMQAQAGILLRLRHGGARRVDSRPFSLLPYATVQSDDLGHGHKALKIRKAER